METLTIKRSVMISIDELTANDIKVTTIDDMHEISNKLLKRRDELLKENKALRSAARHAEPSSFVEAIEVNKNTVDSAGVAKTVSGKGTTLGKKIGKSSKYHFVNIQMYNGKFYTYKASTSIAGKSVGMGSDRDEIQCALLADVYLDEIGDEKRPRNRNDFPEVMTAYKSQQLAQEKK